MGKAQAKARAKARAKASGNVLDRLWLLFTSVRTAVVLIFLVAVASIGGSLIEQEGLYPSALPPEQYYPLRYGPLWGTVFLRLGLTHAYSSTWYLVLLGLLALNLVVCSLHRFGPLWRALRRPPLRRRPDEVAALPAAQTVPAVPGVLDRAAAELRRRGYRVQAPGPGALYAEKGRWSRWGPYITHIGLLLLLAAGISRFVPGWYMDTMVWLTDGQTAVIPGTPWALKNEGFTAAFYDDGRPRLYRTDAVLLADGREVLRREIRVNEPLIYGGYTIYQNSFQTTLGTAELTVRRLADGAEQGRFTVDLRHPQAEYTAGALRVRVKDYFPDFVLDDDSRPVSRSGEPNNPGLVLAVVDADGREGPPQWVFIHYPEMRFTPEAAYAFAVTDVTLRHTTGLRVKRDPALPVVYAGQVITMAGLILTYYLSHRRWWLVVHDGQLLIGAAAHRYHRPLQREVESLAARLREECQPC